VFLYFWLMLSYTMELIAILISPSTIYVEAPNREI